MIQTSKKSILALLLVAVAVFSTLAMTATASETEVDLSDLTSISILSEDGEAIAVFASQVEFEVYMNGGISPMYETCGTGLYQHGQFTYTTETIVLVTFTNTDGSADSYYMMYIQICCSSCDGVIKSYYQPV